MYFLILLKFFTVDRRLDEWITFDKLKIKEETTTTTEETPEESERKLTRNMKRKYNEIHNKNVKNLKLTSRMNMILIMQL
jgi:hypothetical protein